MERRRASAILSGAATRRVATQRVGVSGHTAARGTLRGIGFRHSYLTPVTAAFMIAPYVVVIGAWFAYVFWGLPYLSARGYERNHRACIPHDQVRVVSTDGIEARCVTSDVKIQRHGISRIIETPECERRATRRVARLSRAARACREEFGRRVRVCAARRGSVGAETARADPGRRSRTARR